MLKGHISSIGAAQSIFGLIPTDPYQLNCAPLIVRLHPDGYRRVAHRDNLNESGRTYHLPDARENRTTGSDRGAIMT